MRAGEPPPVHMPHEAAAPSERQQPDRVPLGPPSTVSVGRSRGRSGAKPGSTAPGSALLRPEAFLTVTNQPTQDQHSSGLANRARLIREAAVALRAERAAVLTATTAGTYRGWAVHGLTPTQTRRFLKTERRPLNAPAPSAGKQMTAPSSTSVADFGMSVGRAPTGLRRQSEREQESIGDCEGMELRALEAKGKGQEASRRA